MDVVVAGSLSGRLLLEMTQLLRLAQLEPQQLTHFGAFTGKPETRIHADNQYVLKVNTNRHFQSQDVALKWCMLQLEKERDFAIYHPDRTWLVMGQGDGFCTANLTPRLIPLHCLDFSDLGGKERVRVLALLLDCYLSFATRYQLRLDEGLSNFALLDNSICYLDDDIYPWDSFVSFSAMLANWIRRSDGMKMNQPLWVALADQLAPMLRKHASDACDMVFESMEDQITGNGESLKQCVLHALRPYRPSAVIPNPTAWVTSPDKPVALIADIHANLPALEVVLAELDRRGIERYLMLGDVVGYGPNPVACIELVQERGMACLRGNHDHYVGYSGDVRVAMGLMARRMADWTIEQLDAKQRQWLAELPVRYRTDGWMAVHGAPVDKGFFNAYVYDMTSERNLDWMQEHGVHCCLHGHSHIQGVYSRTAGRDAAFSNNPVCAYGDMDAVLICAGSIGQSRNGQALAQAAIFYPDQQRVEMLALPYDIGRLISDMEQQQFPANFIERVKQGR